jgi:tetratricopeptide (TPR) repeat protein
MYKDSGNSSHGTETALRTSETGFAGKRFVMKFWSLGLLLFFMMLAQPVRSQVDEARQAIAAEEHLEAIEILTPVIAQNPSPDAYLYLGLAHANLSQNDRALELFLTAARLYPNDTRFHDEAAGVHLANGDVEAAVEALNRALSIDADDEYASDLLASVRLSIGNVEGALAIWNPVGRPRIDVVLENFSPQFIHWTVGRALTFGPGDVLTYDAWKTTQARLFRSRLFSNVGLDVEPSGPEDLYNAIVRTSNRTNTTAEIFIDLVRGLPVETTYLDLWDIAYSGISWRSNFRWDDDRRRLQGELIVPLPMSSLPIIEFRDTWRSERWNLGPSIRAAFEPEATFDYKVNSVGVDLKLTPAHQVEIDLGLEYRNRDATGSIAVLGMDERNSGTLDAGLVFHTVDGRYKNQLRVHGFLARESLLGDFSFSGGSVEIANRFHITEDTRTVFDWSVTGGTSRGDLPVDHYFILGLTSLTDYRLRGHVASDGGRYGKAPMGTDFVLLNTDIERRLLRVPLFNTLSIPFIEVKALAFFDSAKTFDRQRVFRQGEWLNDVGAGLRFETPTSAFTVLYGRDINGGENNFYGYVERRFW